MARSEVADAQLTSLLTTAARPARLRLSVFGVGGYGRRELCPGSDLDLLFLHDDGDAAALKALVDGVLYPLWDAGRTIDHSVRTRTESLALAKSDVKVALGLLDARFIAGDVELGADLVSAVLNNWRVNSRPLLDRLRTLQRERVVRSGELAYLLEPDLKEARGGLRDITALRAIAASWVADMPHANIDAANDFLLDVRETLHTVTGRNKDRLLLQEQEKVAAALGLRDGDELLMRVAEAARAVDYASEVTWRRVDQEHRAATRNRYQRRRPVLAERVAESLVLFDGEVALEFDAAVASDELLMLRAGATAAQLAAPLSPITCARLAAAAPRLPEPWPDAARDLFISLIGAGDSTVAVWEALDQAGLIVGLIPEWEGVRNLPQRNFLHRHTVDRHQLESVVHAAALARTVDRPDLLLVAALFHDIGKGKARDHSEVGVRLMRSIGTRMGFAAEDVEILEALVLHHLLLPDTATRRDLDDRQTVINTVEKLGKHIANVDLLHALTIADGLATGGTAWSSWKAKLVDQLVVRIRGAAAGFPMRVEPEMTDELAAMAKSGALDVKVNARSDHFEILVAAPDSPGLLAKVAGVLSLAKLDVRAAKTLTKGASAVMRWQVTLMPYAEAPQPAMLLSNLRRALAGDLDVAARLHERARDHSRRPTLPTPPAVVSVMHDQARDSTLLEIRSHDRPGLLHDVAAAVTGAGVDVHAAIVSTLGSEACDVFYVTQVGGSPLTVDDGLTLARTVEHVIRQRNEELAQPR